MSQHRSYHSARATLALILALAALLMALVALGMVGVTLSRFKSSLVDPQRYRTLLLPTLPDEPPAPALMGPAAMVEEEGREMASGADPRAGRMATAWYGLCPPKSVASLNDFRQAVFRDQRLAAYYSGFNWDSARLETTAAPRWVYVSYQKAGVLARTRRPVLLPQGDTIITDGLTRARTYCCNEVFEIVNAPLFSPSQQALRDSPPLLTYSLLVGALPPFLPLAGDRPAPPFSSSQQALRDLPPLSSPAPGGEALPAWSLSPPRLAFFPPAAVSPASQQAPRDLPPLSSPAPGGEALPAWSLSPPRLPIFPPVEVSPPTAIPEPSTWSLVGIGLAGLAWGRWRAWRRARRDALSHASPGTVAVLVAIGLGAAATSGWAGFDEGAQAYTRGDYATALQEWQPIAEQGNPDAQNALGRMYAEGEGVPQDYPQAVLWYRRAANRGDATAQFHLGFLYAQGQGIPQDDVQAMLWYRRAADQGNAQAQVHLGHLYGRSQDVPHDVMHAYFWYTLATVRLPPGADREEAVRSRHQYATRLQSLSPVLLANAQVRAFTWRPTPETMYGRSLR